MICGHTTIRRRSKMMTIIAMFLEAYTKFSAGELYWGLFVMDFVLLVIFGVYKCIVN